MGWHIDAGHTGCDSVDAIGGSSQTTTDGIACTVDDPGAAALEVQAQATGTSQAPDHDRIGMTIHSSDATDAARCAAAEDQVEVASVDAADILAEGHCEAY